MKHLLLAPFLTARLLVNITFTQINQHNRPDTLKISLPNFNSTNVTQISKGTLRSAYKVPLVLVAGGLFSITDNEILNRAGIYEERNERIPNSQHNADDYIQHAPILAVYGLNLMGIKGRMTLVIAQRYSSSLN